MGDLPGATKRNKKRSLRRQRRDHDRTKRVIFGMKDYYLPMTAETGHSGAYVIIDSSIVPKLDT
jgi:hypothetical protein